MKLFGFCIFINGVLISSHVCLRCRQWKYTGQKKEGIPIGICLIICLEFLKIYFLNVEKKS